MNEGNDGEFKLGEVGFQAEKVEGTAKLINGDEAIVVLVKEIENAAETEGIKTIAAEAKGGGLPGESALGRWSCACCFHGLIINCGMEQAQQSRTRTRTRTKGGEE